MVVDVDPHHSDTGFSIFDLVSAAKAGMTTAATNHVPGFQIDVIAVRVPTRSIRSIDRAGVQFNGDASLGAKAIKPRRGGWKAPPDCRYVSLKVMGLSVVAQTFSKASLRVLGLRQHDCKASIYH
jgi:hypothetical protein